MNGSVCKVMIYMDVNRRPTFTFFVSALIRELRGRPLWRLGSCEALSKRGTKRYQINLNVVTLKRFSMDRLVPRTNSVCIPKNY
jgi:hypothetical protein